MFTNTAFRVSLFTWLSVMSFLLCKLFGVALDFSRTFGKSLGFLGWGQEGQGNSFRTLMSELPSAASYLANYSRVIGAVFAWKPGENS